MSSYRIKNEIAVIKMALEAIELINDKPDRLQDIEDKTEQLEKENAMMRKALEYIAKDKNCCDGCKCEKHTAILALEKINKKRGGGVKDLIEVFRMSELSIDVRIRIIKKLGIAINHEHGANVTDELVDELVSELEKLKSIIT